MRTQRAIETGREPMPEQGAPAAARRIESYGIVDSPVGPLQLAGGDGVLMRLDFGAGRHPARPAASWIRDDAAFADAAAQLKDYFAGRLKRFDLALEAIGSHYQMETWAALREIPYGETVSYGEIARRIGDPGGARAVGMANNANPIAIVVPCHRVIGASGTLTGYAGGIERKRWLLDHESGAQPTLA